MKIIKRIKRFFYKEKILDPQGPVFRHRKATGRMRANYDGSHHRNFRG